MNHGGWKWYLILAALAALTTLGMGSLGGSEEPDEIPRPDWDFTAKAVDRTGLSTQIRQVSLDGKTYIVGKRGDADVTIPFDRIAILEVLSATDDQLMATAELDDQNRIDIIAKPRIHLYGKASFGTFKILLRDVSRIVFDRSQPPLKLEKPAKETKEKKKAGEKSGGAEKSGGKDAKESNPSSSPAPSEKPKGTEKPDDSPPNP